MRQLCGELSRERCLHRPMAEDCRIRRPPDGRGASHSVDQNQARDRDDELPRLVRVRRREGSPLEGLVTECYPSGSFATGTAIASRVAKDQHDVDVVMEIDVAADAAPSIMLEALFNAINGEPGSRYHGKVTQNSRCVTVEYGDG